MLVVTNEDDGGLQWSQFLFFSFFGIRRFVVLNGWLFYLEVCYLELKQLFWTFFTFFFYTVHNLISEMTVFDKPQSFWNAFYFQNKLVAAQHFLSIMRQKMWPNYKLRSSKITEKCNLVSKRSPFSQPNSLFGLPESAVGGLSKAIMKGARKKNRPKRRNSIMLDVQLFRGCCY